jgi:hypothetical protein
MAKLLAFDNLLITAKDTNTQIKTLSIHSLKELIFRYTRNKQGFSAGEYVEQVWKSECNV